MLKFVIPAGAGVATFLLPVKVEGSWTIFMGWLASASKDAAGSLMPWLVLAVLAVSALGGLLYTLRHRDVRPDTLSARLFKIAPIWLVIRIIGLLIGTMTLFKLGPELIWGAATGGTVVNELATSIIPIFLFAGFLMPLLTDYGLMEFMGTLLRGLFRRLFTLPGRAAIDALASWMSSAPVGILITIQQYKSGYYSGREAAVIATNFSVVSVPFALLVATTVDIDARFPEYYAVVVLTGFITAMLLPRLPPLRGIADAAFDQPHPDLADAPSAEGNLVQQALQAAVTRATKAPPLREQGQRAVSNILDIWLGLVPAVVAVGGIGLMLAEGTQVLHWLATPIVPLLQWLALPEAEAAAPAVLAGFLDMFLPALLVTGVEAEITRFVIAALSITQLIYMSEVGILLLKSEIPLRFGHLLAVFLLRTAISLPLIAAFAHWFVYP